MIFLRNMKRTYMCQRQDSRGISATKDSHFMLFCPHAHMHHYENLLKRILYMCVCVFVMYNIDREFTKLSQIDETTKLFGVIAGVI